ncbi:OmpW family protein|uniref:OmpW/AlkL family protein n=1 Tax=Stenotrophomonas sp. SbOxS2 TaxID=2723885 RepID=UPI0015D2DD6E|nr:OmpW family outer membrane protein [Stenotrophomonas sp. SbOxS2]NYT99446.1 OmpW family protein [Stenotrophomonas sp. SbOxS2]
MGQSGAALAADDARWYLRLGPGHLNLNESIDISVFGQTLPQAHASMTNDTSLISEVGFQATPQWSVGLTFGIPLKARFSGTGSISDVGELSQAKYGPVVLSVQYRFNAGGKFTPYVGFGVVRLIVFSTSDRALQNFDIEGAWGSALQVGAEYRLSAHTGLFLAATKGKLSTKAHGQLGDLPVQADIDIKPLLVHSGVVFRF